MDTDRSLQASFWLMVILQTLGSVDMPGSGNRKMPAPKAYVPVIIAWSGLHLAADAGMDRGAATAGWVMVLAGMVVGPSGKRLIGFLNGVANRYGAAPQSTVATGSTSLQPVLV